MEWIELDDVTTKMWNNSAGEMWISGDTNTSTSQLSDILHLALPSNASLIAEIPNSTMDFNNDTLNGCLDLHDFDFSTLVYEYRKSTWVDITWKEVLKLLAYIITFFVSLVGNVLVILVVKCNTNMRSSTNQYLVNLAVADMCVTLVCTWAHIVRTLTLPNYILPGIVCKLDAFVQATALVASVFTLTVISIGRFVAIMFPLHARTSPDRAIRVIAVVWIASALISSPMLIYREKFSTQWLDFTSYNCEEFFPTESKMVNGFCELTYDGKKVYYIIFTITCYIIPVFIMLLNYSFIVWKLWRTQQPGEQHQQVPTSPNTRRGIRMLTVVLLVFVVCWTPLQSIILYGAIKNSGHGEPHESDWIHFIAYFMAHTNSALNPIIYCGFNAKFRQGLVALLSYRNSRGGRLSFLPCRWNGLARTPSTISGYSGPDPAVLIRLDSMRHSRLTQKTSTSSLSGRLVYTGSRREFCHNNHNNINNLNDTTTTTTTRGIIRGSTNDGDLQVALAQRTFVRASYRGENGRLNNHGAAIPSLRYATGGRDDQEDMCGCCCTGGERGVEWREGISGMRGWGRRSAERRWENAEIGRWGRQGRWGTVEKVVISGGVKNKGDQELN